MAAYSRVGSDVTKCVKDSWARTWKLQDDTKVNDLELGFQPRMADRKTSFKVTYKVPDIYDGYRLDNTFEAVKDKDTIELKPAVVCKRGDHSLTYSYSAHLKPTHTSWTHQVSSTKEWKKALHTGGEIKLSGSFGGGKQPASCCLESTLHGGVRLDGKQWGTLRAGGKMSVKDLSNVSSEAGASYVYSYKAIPARVGTYLHVADKGGSTTWQEYLSVKWKQLTLGTCIKFNFPDSKGPALLTGKGPAVVLAGQAVLSDQLKVKVKSEHAISSDKSSGPSGAVSFLFKDPEGSLSITATLSLNSYDTSNKPYTGIGIWIGRS
eukprot:Sspe_Gene.82170::Locus_53837_Transcript_1_1_Confidence_1.000_Length_1208::g.82170::m.82170